MALTTEVRITICSTGFRAMLPSFSFAHDLKRTRLTGCRSKITSQIPPNGENGEFISTNNEIALTLTAVRHSSLLLFPRTQAFISHLLRRMKFFILIDRKSVV